MILMIGSLAVTVACTIYLVCALTRRYFRAGYLLGKELEKRKQIDGWLSFAAKVKLQREHSRTDGGLCCQGRQPQPSQREGSSKNMLGQADRKQVEPASLFEHAYCEGFRDGVTYEVKVGAEQGKRAVIRTVMSLN